MIKYFIITLFFFSSLLIAQEKYFIYFSDKGFDSKSGLSKTSELYKEAENSLSKQAIDRRKKTMGDDFITYDDIPIYKNYLDELNLLGIKIVHKLNWFNAVSAYLSQDQINILIKLPFVKSIEAVKKIYYKDPSEFGNSLSKTSLQDSIIRYGNSLTQLQLSDVPLVHARGIYGDGVIVGILDSGFDWKRHESLKDRKVIGEYDFVFNDSVTANQTGDAVDQDRHGTLIFSLIAGYVDSVMIGPAFNASYILAKTEDVRTETHVEEDNYAAALIWMESLGVDITTSSLGYSEFDSPETSYTYSDMNGKTTIVTKAAELAFERGVSTFTAAGNEGTTKWKYITAPADGFNIIAVGAVDRFGNKASFSSFGPTFDGRIKPEVVAMGVSDFGAVAGTVSNYTYANGTSTSTPISSGIGALLLSASPHLTNVQIRDIILKTSSNTLTPNNQIGYGIISASKAVEFPNLEFSNSNYIIHKVILNKKVIPNSFKLSYAYDGATVSDILMNKSNDYTYTFTLPQLLNGKKVRFHISYSDSLSQSFRSPEVGEYEFNYGTLVISENQNKTINYDFDVITDFFPNPFLPITQKSTMLIFKSTGNELFKIAIIDGSGQKVVDNSFYTIPGDNYFEWNGFSDRGLLCASGVYYALINFNGKEFGKKLVLLK